MWFAKWFGGRRDEEEDTDEPARFAPPVPPPAQPANSAAARPADPVKSPAPKQKGFDPYNSGSFEHRNAWERVNRR
jgi:hypothetical protein